MSARKHNLQLTEPAIKDFRDILAFTLQAWGEQQHSEYKHKIDRALTEISVNPHIGFKKHGLHAFRVGRHQIFYRIHGDAVYVLRILHERMDTIRHLSKSEAH